MNIVIVGAGGHGKVILNILQHDPDTKLVGFVDDDANSHHTMIDGFPVLGSIDSLPALTPRYQLDGAIIAIGDNRIRGELFGRMKEWRLTLKSAIHPHAFIARDVKIGEGVVIAAGAIIGTGSRIGNNVIINTRAIIDHEDIIEDHVHISPGVTIAGKVVIGQYSHVGLGVTVVQDLTIGENATVGAGAVVLADIPANTTAVGVPARVIKYKKSDKEEISG